jgi:ubiquinone/menaquinone biosynthesis C-methylase UbiE
MIVMPKLGGVSYKKRIMMLYNEPSYVKTYDRRYYALQLVKYEIILPYLDKKSKYLLDVGIGTGLILEKIVKRCKLIVGVDISLHMLNLAKKRVKNYANVELILADADHLPFKENIFPTVTTFTLLQNMPNPLKTLKELIRVSNAVVSLAVLKKKIDEMSLQELLQKSGKEFEIIEGESEDIFAVCYVK